MISFIPIAFSFTDILALVRVYRDMLDALPLPELAPEELQKLTKAEKRKRRRATPKYRNLHATRER